MPYQKNISFETPDGNNPIWRYRKLEDLIYILENQSLCFPAIYTFEDRWEGSLSSHTYRSISEKTLIDENTPVKKDENFYSHIEFIKHEKELQKKHPDLFKDRQIGEFDHFAYLLDRFVKNLMFCNCWSLKENEDALLWERYGHQNSSCVAIQSTIERMVDSFNASRAIIHIGKVKYKDYNKEHIKGFENFHKINLEDPNCLMYLFYAPMLVKRNAYETEDEIRAIISYPWICEEFLDRVYLSDIPFYGNDGFYADDIRYREHLGKREIMFKSEDKYHWLPRVINIKVNLDTLVEKIVISPKANYWFLYTLKNLVEKYGVSGDKVVASSL